MASAQLPAPAPAAAKTPATQSPVQEFLSNLQAMRSQFEPFLPDPIKLEKFFQTCAFAVQMNAKLLEADRQSLYNECLKAAQDGLQVDGREAVLNIYNTNLGTREAAKWVKTVKYMPMVQGLLKKIRNSGELKSLHVDVVYGKDTFESWADETGPHYKHIPCYDDRGDVRLAYAVAITKDGAVYLEIMTQKDLEAVRKVSRTTDKDGKSSGPWGGDFADEMRKKSVIRRLSKRLPMSSDLDDFVRRVDADIDLEGKDTPAPAAPAAPTTSARLTKAVEKTGGEQPAPAAPAAAPAAPAAETPL